MLVLVVLVLFGQSLTYGDSCQFCAISEEYLRKNPGDVDKWKTYCGLNYGLCQLSNWGNLPCACDAFHNCDVSAGVLLIGVTFGECVLSPFCYIIGGVLCLLFVCVTMYCCERHNYKGFPPKITPIVLILILLIIITITIILLSPHIPLWSSFVSVTLIVVAMIYGVGKLLRFKGDPELKRELDPLIQVSESVHQPVIPICEPGAERLLDPHIQENENAFRHAIAICETDTKNLGYCVVCLVEPVTRRVVPCGHACMCERDAHILGNSTVAVCPMCRKRIKSIIEVY